MLKTVILLMSLGVFLLLCANLTWAENWALLVGINDYKYNSIGIADLKFCENDVDLFKETLIKYANFKEDNIKVLKSEEATKKNIKSGFLDWLAVNAKPGDKVIFYFSGHGVQLKDYDGDEEDGLDEYLVVHDSASLDIYFVSDDELGDWLDKVNTPNKTVILDCCHSGTGTKEVTLGYSIKSFEPDPNAIKHVPSSRDVQPGQIGQSKPVKPGSDSKSASSGTSKDISNVALLSACRADQVSMETPSLKHGVLTYYLTKSIELGDRNGDGKITLDELKEQVSRDIQTNKWRQEPQLDLDPPNIVRIIVGDEPQQSVSQPFGTITQILKDQQVKLALGSENGVTEASIYAVFDAKADLKTDKEKGRIKILSASDKDSTALMLNPFDIKVGDKVSEVAHYNPTADLMVKMERFEASKGVDASQAQTIANMLQNELAKQPHLTFVSGSDPADKLVRGKVSLSPTGKYVISARVVDYITGDPADTYSVEGSADALAKACQELASKLGSELRYGYVLKTLSKLENPNPKFRVRLSVDKGNNAVYKVGEPVKFYIESDRDCYVTLIDVTTSGTVYVLFPNKFEPDNFIKAGKRYEIPSLLDYDIEVGEPEGQEVVKVIATLQKMNLADINIDKMQQPFKSHKEDADKFSNSLTENLASGLSSLESKDLRLVELPKWSEDSVAFTIKK